MANAITGFIGVTLVVVFLGYYAYDLASPPLVIIIALVLIMVIVDYVQSLTGKGQDSNKF